MTGSTIDLKKVPNQTPCKSGTLPVYLVYDYISKGLQPKYIRRNKLIPKRTLQRHIKQLVDADLIKKVGYGTWEITERELSPETIKRRCQIKPHVGKGFKVAPSTSSYRFPKVAPSSDNFIKPSSIRGHAFVVRQEIPKLKNWDNRLQILKKAKIPHERIDQGERARIKVGEIEKVHLCNESIIWYMRGLSFFGKTPTIACNKALEFLLAHIRKLENMIGIDAHNLKIRKGYKLHFSRQHYALIKNALAQKYNDEKKKLYVFDENGLWMIIDKSYNVDELEGVRNDTAKDEMTFMKSYFNDLNKTRLMPSTALHLITGNAKNHESLVKNMGVYAQNLMAHVESVKALSTKTSDFTSAVLNFKDEIKAQLGKLGEALKTQSRPKLDDKPIPIEIIKDTGKFYSILNGETHLYDLKEGAKIYLNQKQANALIKNGYATEMKGL